MTAVPEIFGTHEEATLAQLADVASRAERAAIMADGHLGYIMPVGGVAAYRNQVSVAGVGFDIACGNAAILTDGYYDTIHAYRSELANEIQAAISFGVGRNNRSDDAPVDDPLFDDPAWGAVPESHRDSLRDKARAQLGTVGSGNHYVDVFRDERAGRVWVGVHFGSRGFGHTIASSFLALAQGGKWGDRVPEQETLLELSTPLGDAYWSLMELAGRYAYVGREWVARKVVELLGFEEMDLIHNHHNFAWRETHGGEDFVVVRKGATPAWPGQRGFVGGSMGDESVILRGTLNPTGDALRALHSTVHGAGRVMSRTEAKGKIKRGPQKWHCRGRDCDFVGARGGFFHAPGGPRPRCPNCGHKLELRHEQIVKKTGKVTPGMMGEWLAAKDVILRGGGLDESPHAYRRLPEVLESQGATVEVLEVLHPVIVVMAGDDEFDPYKD